MLLSYFNKFQAALKKTLGEETVPEFFTMYENLLVGNNGGDGYFVGDSVSIKKLKRPSSDDHYHIHEITMIPLNGGKVNRLLIYTHGFLTPS